ncbi:hypothetical protein LCGC14_1989540 [marine sediment metagenome]|uniref:Helix-hairpin-helix DNA-binding motif class 1 domain-containing protein n=1 Tax=marine sediment metagenome TaxID=412755 RepID=A0A0F9HJT4_9ZZZZ
MIRKSLIALFVSFILTSSIVFAEDKINLNTATSEQLQMLDGVGPATAAAILSYREQTGKFDSVEQLVNVRGIGEKKLESMSDKLTVSSD